MRSGTQSLYRFLFVECKVPRFVVETRVSSLVEDVWQFHSSLEALKLLSEPSKRVQLVGNETEVKNGALHIVRIRKFGIGITLKVRISEVSAPSHFRDTQEKGPFARWTHSHEFTPIPGGTLIRDTVDYKAPGGSLSSLIDRLFIAPDLQRMWRHRQSVTWEHLGRHFE